MIKGSHHTKETKAKIGKVHKGKTVSAESRAKMSKAHKGKGHSQSEVTRSKISKAHKGRVFTEEHKAKLSANNACYLLGKTGEQHPSWQGGISFEPYSPEFNRVLKDSIRERDNHTCQLCGKTEKENGKRLAVHHINYDKKDCNDGNLISLCQSCNSVVNFSRDDWIDYFVQHKTNMYAGGK